MSTQNTAGTARGEMTMDTEHAEMARIIGDLRRAERERAEATARAERAERERDDLAALNVARVAAHAHAMAQLAAVTTERDVLRAQQAPLVDAHDALVAAARAAGWTGAGATGAELVAWVRRGEREACAWVADDEARDSEGNEGAVCAAQSIAATIRGREGGE